MNNKLRTNMCVVCESNNTRVKLTGDPDHPTTPSPSLKKNLQVPLASPSEKRYIIHIRTYRICKLEGSPFSHNVLSLFGNFFFCILLVKILEGERLRIVPPPGKILDQSNTSRYYLWVSARRSTARLAYRRTGQ